MVVAALRAALKGMGREAAGSPVAAAALVLAGKLDDVETSATAAAACAKELREHLAELRRMVPEKPADSSVEKILARAAKRKAAA